MLSSDKPPAAARAVPPPAIDKTIDYLSTDRTFHIPVAGIYHLRFDAVMCPLSADVVAADGHSEHLADNSQAASGSLGADSPVFLGAGDWKVVYSGSCGWQLTVSPWTGPLGGGSQGFG
jgi:hypothetical protein